MQIVAFTDLREARLNKACRQGRIGFAPRQQDLRIRRELSIIGVTYVGSHFRITAVYQ